MGVRRTGENRRMKTPTLAAALALALLFVIVVYIPFCHDPKVRAAERAMQRDAQIDTVIVDAGRETRDSLKAFARTNDALRRENVRLRDRIVHRDTVSVVDSIAIRAQLAIRDSLIAVLEAGRRADSLELLFWRSQVTQRDSIIAVLQNQRNAYRGKSERRLACVAGGSVTVSLDGRSAIGPGVTCGWKL
jgi:hypothetical protein